MKRTVIGILLLGIMGVGTMAAEDGNWNRRQEVRHDHARIEHDRAELRHDRYTGHYRAAAHERAELRHDRRDLRHDRYYR